MTEGTRYSFIPILFGDNAVKRYEVNTAHLGPGVTPDRREFVVDA